MATTGSSRDSLPVPDSILTGTPFYDAKDDSVSFPPIRQTAAPDGAPNVLVILLDDVGFAASSAFGGPCQTPVAERLSDQGLRYSRFHTTALCAPTRAALLTGRNHHSVGMGALTELATAAPGYSSVRPNTKAPLAEILRLNGYSTAQFGKCHEVPTWQTSPMGPFDAWPTGSGFEHFYGFLGGETNQYAPSIYLNTVPVEPEKSVAEGYHFTEDMTDRAIDWVRQQHALAADKPFFLYFAPGATHAPHQVPLEWADRYRGQFDDGWDALRERIFARQQALGVIGPEAQLTARPEEIPSWDSMPEELRPVLARQMEVYAGFLEHTDHHIGRLIDAIDDLGTLENTLVIYIVGDNGASAEGGPNGTFNELFYMNGVADMETPDFMVERVDLLGTEHAYNHYALGWSWAMDTPYQWTKQVASHWGGTRNGTIVHWPAGFASRGEVRHQFHHVIDVAPTVLEVAGIPHPTFVHGVQQAPIEGVSMAETFADADAVDRHVTQYFEIGGNRGIYHHGWTAVTKHATPWIATGQLPAFDDDTWELYAPDDWSQANDLAEARPDKLRELQRVFLLEAARYGVFPLDDRRVERFDATLAGRPQLVKGATQRLYSGMGRLTEGTVLSIKNRSHVVTASLDVASDTTGVVVAQGGAFGGWSLYLDGGRLAYCYNFLGVARFTVKAEVPLTPGEHAVAMDFSYDGGGPARGGDVTLLVDGAAVASGRVERTHPLLFSLDETTDVGADLATPVSTDYTTEGSRFTGTIHWVEIALVDEADPAHQPTAEERLRALMARQ